MTTPKSLRRTLAAQSSKVRIEDWLEGVAAALSELAQELRKGGCSESAWFVGMAAQAVCEERVTKPGRKPAY